MIFCLQLLCASVAHVLNFRYIPGELYIFDQRDNGATERSKSAFLFNVRGKYPWPHKIFTFSLAVMAICLVQNHDNDVNITHVEEIRREQLISPLSYTRLAPPGVGGQGGEGNYWVPVNAERSVISLELTPIHFRSTPRRLVRKGAIDFSSSKSFTLQITHQH